jgi:two-component sensor histidine kinase
MLYIERGLYAYAQKLLREDPDIDLSNDTYELIIRCLQIFKYTQVEDEENLLKALLNHRSVNKIEVAQRYLKMQKSYEDNPVSEFAPVYRKIKLTIRYLKRLDPDFKNIFDLHENFDLLD